MLAILFLVSVATHVPDWLPDQHDSASLIGTLLTAQAAIAALTVAVTLFAMQVIGTRRNAEDRTHKEYIRRSWVRPISSWSVAAVGATGFVLLALHFGGSAEVAAADAQGLGNLALFAPVGFTANLALAVVLLYRAIHLSGPDQWRKLRLAVFKDQVREAVQVFLGRVRRAAAARNNEEPDFTTAFPDPGEEAASEAIRAVLGDAQRAIEERLSGEFARSLDSVRELVEHAMEEIEQAGVRWAPPGSQPSWPPLRELDDDLYSLRKEVIGRDDREHVEALLHLDYWLLSTGMLRGCGELFTVALEGYRKNSEIARRTDDNESTEPFRDRVWQLAQGLILHVSLTEAEPYLTQMVRHQERLLSDAMALDLAADFERIHKAFQSVLRAVRYHRDLWETPRAGPSGLYQQLEQNYRIALMGLGGRAVLLAEAGTITELAPYLNVVAGEYGDPDRLASDLGPALDRDDRMYPSQWFEWEREGAQSLELRPIEPKQYPLNYFVVRLLELAFDGMPALNLQGHASRVLDWFNQNSAWLSPYAQPDGDMTIEQCHEAVVAALQTALGEDSVSEDHELISRQLSQDRVDGFVASVYAGAFSNNAIESIFRRNGAFLYLSNNAGDIPEERGFRQFERKAFLAEAPEGAKTYYAPLEIEEFGWTLADDILQLLCEALDDAPRRPSPIETGRAFLRAVDRAIEDLSPSGEVLGVLAGDWNDIVDRLDLEEPTGYVPRWRSPEAEYAQYRGIPLLIGPEYGQRRLFVVEPSLWGCLVRAQVEGDRDLLVEVEPITAERAQYLLDANPAHFPDEPDAASKLRRLQTLVEVGVAARVEFRVVDPSRARRINPSE